MKRYEVEANVLSRSIVGVSIHAGHMNDEIRNDVIPVIEEMEDLLNLIQNEEAEFNILNVIATFSEKLSYVGNRLNNYKSTPESMFNLLIQDIYTELSKKLYQEGN